MWHTSAGDRILEGAEAALIRAAIGSVTDTLILEADDEADPWQYGVPALDSLSCPQRFALLCEVGEALLQPEVAMPELTALREATVAVLYAAVQEGIEVEAETEQDDPSPEYDARYWRRLTLAAASQWGGESAAAGGLPSPHCRDQKEWDWLVDGLADCVLWDADWMEGDLLLDLAPEHAAKVKRMMNIASDYFTAIAPDPSDRKLLDIRARLRALTRA